MFIDKKFISKPLENKYNIENFFQLFVHFAKIFFFPISYGFTRFSWANSLSTVSLPSEPLCIQGERTRIMTSEQLD
jgi:hypothetical protein